MGGQKVGVLLGANIGFRLLLYPVILKQVVQVSADPTRNEPICAVGFLPGRLGVLAVGRHHLVVRVGAKVGCFGALALVDCPYILHAAYLTLI